MSAFGLLIVVIVTLPIMVGEVVLQVILSQRKTKWVGLILPALSFLISVSLPLIVYNGGTGFIWWAIGIFILANVPTVILLVIYFVCRASKPKQPQPVQLDLHNELNKMNIQDLD